MIEVDYKKLVLTEKIKELGSVAVAFSSGVDSTFLLKHCHDVLGDKVLAITASSNAMPKRELDEAISFCKENGIRHIVFDASELNKDILLENPANRCYLCKKAIFTRIIEIANENGISAVLEGSNVDDDDDYRPGSVAIKELGVLSPLHEVGLDKSDIRWLSKQLGLKTAVKPSFSCLAMRFEVGESITAEKLALVDKSEQLLYDFGFTQFRVRVHKDLARIEVLPEQIDMLVSNKEAIAEELKDYGFRYISMDLTGYKMGNMNPQNI